MDIFPELSDRITYLKLIGEQAAKDDMQILVYCLMDNHVHFLVIPAW
jgi:REP-associated tyrosine transposase